MSFAHTPVKHYDNDLISKLCPEFRFKRRGQRNLLMAFSVGVILAVLCLFNRKDQWPGGFAISVEEWALKTFLVIFGIM